ncbi:MAG: Ig-like domain repeat protein [Actinophytocola sp.]|uniref:RCC1 domain-containing protein n=1 Tax=Actinophytocola sp. TaxID=1872138 RepID=UPI003C719C87
MRFGVRRMLAASVAVAMALPLAVAMTVAMAGPASAAPGDEVLTWGRNQYGQLGNGTLNAAGEPLAGPVVLPAGTSVTAVSGGYGFSVALLSTGEVLTWGYNDEGQLGDGSFVRSTVPVYVDLPSDTTITAIAAGDDHILALTATGQVLAWGYNEWGQLGDGTTADKGVPVAVNLPAGTTVTAISAGAGHSMALTATGEVLAWGDNDFGQLGDGTATSHSEPALVHVPAGTVVTTIAGSDDHGLALTAAGDMLAWGYNGSGQLGDGTITSRREPVLVHLPANMTVTGIAGASGFQSFALTATGALLSWGDNANGQLGDGTTTTRREPVLVHLPAGTAVTAVASGDDHTVALTAAGEVLSWGYNRYGQVGDGTNTNRAEPVEVQRPGGARVVAIGSGSYHSLAITLAPETTTALTAEPARSRTGDPVTFSAAVACNVGVPTGTVTFNVGDQEIGAAAIEDGVATLVTDALPEGEHHVVARYAGDDMCPPSNSAAVTVTVTAPDPGPGPPGPGPGEPTAQPPNGGGTWASDDSLANSGLSDHVRWLAAAAVAALAIGGMILVVGRRRHRELP